MFHYLYLGNQEFCSYRVFSCIVFHELLLSYFGFFLLPEFYIFSEPLCILLFLLEVVMFYVSVRFLALWQIQYLFLKACSELIRIEQDFYWVCSDKNLELVPVPLFAKPLFRSLSSQVLFSFKHSSALCSGSTYFWITR